MHQAAALVSIIMPSYNAAKLIVETIDSVIAQSYAHWELIVVDDGSKDDTTQVVSRFATRDNRIRLVGLVKNHGAPAAPRNIGVADARGEWVAFLDADDIWHPRKLELQLKMLEEKNGVFACTQMQDFHEASDIHFSNPGTYKIDEIDFATQRIKGRIPTSSVVLKTDLARAFPFREEMSYKAVEDYECWLRILQTQITCFKIAATLLMYRRLPGQISGSKLLMLRRVYRVHSEFPGTPRWLAVIYSATHAVGGVYFRMIRGRL